MTNRAICCSNDPVCKTAVRLKDDQQTLGPFIGFQPQCIQRRSAEQIRGLHRRAGQWYQGEQLWGEAMNHIMAARDYEWAAEMIDENIAGLIHAFSRSNAPLILSWIEKLPEEIRHSRPWIDVYRASMLALNLQLDEVDPILDSVQKQVHPDSARATEIQGHIAAVRAYTANLRGNAARVMEMAALAKKNLPGTESLATRGIVAYALADTYFAQDEMENAGQELFALLEIGQKANQPVIIVPALCDLAVVRKVQGKLHQAEELYRRARQSLVERNALDSRVVCAYEFGEADLRREWNQLEAAHAHAMAGIEYRSRWGGYKVIGDLALMRVLQAQGDVEGAMRALRDGVPHPACWSPHRAAPPIPAPGTIHHCWQSQQPALGRLGVRPVVVEGHAGLLGNHLVPLVHERSRHRLCSVFYCVRDTQGIPTH